MRKTKKRNTKRNNKRRSKRNNKRRTKRNNKRRLKRNNKRRSYKGGMWNKYWNKYKVSGYDLSFEPEKYYVTKENDTYGNNARREIENLFEKFKKNITIYNFSKEIIRNITVKDKFFATSVNEVARLRDDLEEQQRIIEKNCEYYLENDIKKEEEVKRIKKFFDDNKDLSGPSAITLMKKYNKFFIKEKTNYTIDTIDTNDKIQYTNIAIEKQEGKKQEGKEEEGKGKEEEGEEKEKRRRKEENFNSKLKKLFQRKKVIDKEIEKATQEGELLAKAGINEAITDIRKEEKQKNYETFISKFFIAYNTMMEQNPNLLYQNGHSVQLLNIMRYIYNYERILLLEYIIHVLYPKNKHNLYKPYDPYDPY